MPKKTKRNTQHAQNTRKTSSRTNSVQHCNPHGNSGDQQRGKAGRRRLLRPSEPAVAKTNQQNSHNEPVKPMFGGRHRLPLHSKRPEKKRARNDKAAPAHKQRRQSFNGNLNAQVSGTPNQVNGRKREKNPALWRRLRQIHIFKYPVPLVGDLTAPIKAKNPSRRETREAERNLQ